MAKGGQGGQASPGTPSFGQEIVSLKKSIEEKNKAVAELKAKLEAQDKELENAVSTVQHNLKWSTYIFVDLFLIFFKLLLMHFGTN